MSVLSLLLNINIYLDDTWMRNIYLDGTWMTNIYLDGTWMTNIYLDDTPGPWQSSRCSASGSCNQTPAKLPPGKCHQQRVLTTLVTIRRRTMTIRFWRNHLIAVDKDGVVSLPGVAHWVPQVGHIHVVIPQGRNIVLSLFRMISPLLSLESDTYS